MSPERRTAPPSFIRLAADPVRWRLMGELATSDLRVRELVGRVGQPQNLVSYHLRVLREGGLVSARRSSSDGRDSYYRLHLDRCADALTDSGAALHPMLRRQADVPIPPPDPGPSRRVAVLFVCTGNSARSAIAEALLRERTAGRVGTASAGTRPKPSLHPDTVRVLREMFGIDVAGQRTRHLDDVADRGFDHVITLCDKAREVCPDVAHHPRRAHWSVPDPATADDGYRAFERVAADIDTRIGHLLPVLDVTARQEEQL